MIDTKTPPDWYYREHLRDDIRELIDQRFNALMFEVTEKTGNGNNPQFMNPLHALMYEAFYLGNSGTRRVDYAKFEKRS